MRVNTEKSGERVFALPAPRRLQATLTVAQCDPK
jgi:hypothetical protein